MTDLVTPEPAADVARCPFPHGAAPAAPEVQEPAAAEPEPEAAEPVASDAATCPFPHAALAAASAPATGAPGCPVLHGPHGVRRTKADLVVRRVLRIKERPAGESQATAYSAFQRSMLISATRCTLTYVVFPFLLPFLHFLRGGAPVIGVLIGSVAMVADVFTIRRFFAIDHKWRWYFATIVFGIMCLLSVLLVQDVLAIVDHLTA
ncbi:MAG: hypothetical protein R2746_02540 [Acidimicrobiales bacterium]